MPTNNINIDEDTTTTRTDIAQQISHLNGYQGQIAAKEQPRGKFLAGMELMNLIKKDYQIPDDLTNYSIYVSRLGISTRQPGCVVYISNEKSGKEAKAISIGDQRVPNPTHLYEIHSPDQDAIRIKSIILANDSDSDMLIEYIANIDSYDKTNS